MTNIINITKDDFNKLIEKIDNNKNDFNKLIENSKNDFNTLIEKINKIENTITDFKNDIKTLNNYNKVTQEVAEISALDKVVDLYLKNSLCATAKILQWREVYSSKDNNIITDIDGCFVIKYSGNIPNTKKKLEELNIDSSSPLYNMNFVDNSSKLTEYKSAKFIIIESKHYLDKVHIDKKMNQILQIEKIINDSKIITLDNLKNSKYKDMIKDNNIKNIPNDIILIFVAENSSDLIKQYIKNINNGIDKNIYEMLCINLLNRTGEYDKLCREYKKVQKINKKYTIKENLTDISNYLKINKNNDIEKLYESVLNIYSDYDEEFYKKFINKIGYIINNDVFGIDENLC